MDDPNPASLPGSETISLQLGNILGLRIRSRVVGTI
jgi:hypothetical protein